MGKNPKMPKEKIFAVYMKRCYLLFTWSSNKSIRKTFAIPPQEEAS
jgi:hypothetical protein